MVLVVKDVEDEFVGTFPTIGTLIDHLEKENPLYSITMADRLGDVRRIRLSKNEWPSDYKDYFVTSEVIPVETTVSVHTEWTKEEWEEWMRG